MEAAVRENKAKYPKVPVLSFFTGAGLLDIGFIDAGFEFVWHNESDADFAHGFEYGMECLYGEHHQKASKKIQNRNPLEMVTARAIEREAFGSLGKPELFGIIGGPPCPDFSSAGKFAGKDGVNGYLSQVFVDRILGLRPTFFLFENVPGLLRMVKNRDYLAHMLDQLTVNYFVDVNVLNALDHGVPQDRNRIFLVGFRRDWLRSEKGFSVPEAPPTWRPILETIKRKLTIDRKKQARQYELPLDWEQKWFPWPRDERYYGAKTNYKWPTTSPFGANVPRPGEIPDALMVGTYLCDNERLATLPNADEAFTAYSDKFYLIREGDVSGKSFKRLHRWRYSPPAAYGNNEVHLHPTKPRRLTVREAMLIQSVPDKYALPEEMTLSKKFKTVANGVPVKLSRALAKQIAKVVFMEDPTVLLP